MLLSHSLRSVGSEVDIADLSPTSSSPSSAGLTYIAMPADTSMATDDIEDVWRNHVNRVMTDNSGIHAVNTFHLFARLLQETRHCVDSVTKDACGYLARSNATKNLATQLLTLLDLLTTEMECPLVFVDAEAMVTCHLVEKHKFGLLEIHESYETYLMRREQTTEHLQAIKTTMKNSSISGCLVEHCSDELKARMKARMVSLCHCLYQLHFQLVQLFEGYSKLLVNLSKLTNPTKVADLSKDTLELKEELQKAAVEQEPVLQLTNSVCRSDIETLILDSISSQNYKKAVQCMQQFKLLFPGDMFGVHPTDEVESILFVYCQHQSEVKPGVIAVCRSPHNCCEQVCAQLMEIKIQVSAAAQFVQVTKAHVVEGKRGKFSASCYTRMTAVAADTGTVLQERLVEWKEICGRHGLRGSGENGGRRAKQQLKKWSKDNFGTAALPFNALPLPAGCSGSYGAISCIRWDTSVSDLWSYPVEPETNVKEKNTTHIRNTDGGRDKDRIC
ncbi:hypothetical protein LSAT2_008670 [Lamellibrachia satsuma]|nr:hypothetical protein LSAT2_008670 [Lamellibrachia satsuma]